MEKQSTMILTEDNFIKIFLTLLHNYGVHEINAEELSKKLFYYYENSIYSEIFQNIKKVACVEQIEIKNSIKREIVWGSGIVRSYKEPSKLLLAYEFDNLDLSKLNISQFSCELLERMAKEFALRYKIEKNSKFNMNIYGTTPNRDYVLLNGDRFGNSIKWEMITDGEIDGIPKLIEDTNCSCKNFSNFSQTILLPTRKMFDVNIKDASYSIMQGKLDDRVMDIKIYTESLDEETLQKISDVANTSYGFSKKYKSIDCPYVKKLSIK